MAKYDLDPIQDEVVLVDDSGFVLESMSKMAVHGANTPLHLGFSVYVFNNRFQLLMTRRSSLKSTWPSVWSNSFCGHPSPGESFYNAIQRRAMQELGIRLADIAPILPRFRYRCRMLNGTTENEICPVFRAKTIAEPKLNPAEVDDSTWMEWRKVMDQLFISPWARLQIDELRKLGAPEEWPRCKWDLLPDTVACDDQPRPARKVI